MRINREILLKLTRQFVSKTVYENRNLVCIYLTGSLIREEPLLGGTTDIDLFFIHDREPPSKREIVPLSEDIHFDIAHLPQKVFRQPREIRSQPWIGSFICQDPILLHGTQHWFEYTQASICAQYDRPEFKLLKARPLIEEARSDWMEINLGSITNPVDLVWKYLKSLENASNAIAVLSGPPLTDRRFLMDFPERAQEINRPGLTAGFSDIMMPRSISVELWKKWLNQWDALMSQLGKEVSCPPSLQDCRKNYYSKAASVIWDTYPEAALWPIYKSWTKAIRYLSEKSSFLKEWEDISLVLGFINESFNINVQKLDEYLDIVEDSLDDWQREHGL
ncbi:MAG: hypothetical protein JEZ06_08310 [Anaerolineaceae bacterium]|nr:hypothetical protein [Anaerolineaceae bacterium]